MDALIVVEVLDGHGRVAARQRFEVSADSVPLTIGRAITCDVVLDDAHVAARHVELRVTAGGAVHVTDLGSINGITLNGKRSRGASGALLTQPELQLGLTRLRIRTHHEVLAPEQPHGASWRRGSLLWWVLGAAAVVYGFAAFERWLPAPDNLLPSIGEDLLSMSAALAVWISAWTLLGRINSGEWRWLLNAAVCLAGIAISDVVLLALRLLLFAFQSTHGAGLTLIVTALLVGGFGYAQLRAVTRVRPRQLAMVVALITCVSFGGTTWFSSQRLARNVDNVEAFEPIYPPAFRWVEGADPERWFAAGARLKRGADEKRRVALTQEP